MATTNLQQWNPTAANQETDVEYTADSQRAGGATDPSVFEAALANKAFFQWSTYLAALFQAFAAKGFTTSDSNINTLAAQCANFLTTADLRSLITDLNYSPNPVLDGSKTNGWFFPLSGNMTIPTIPGLVDGQIVTLVYLQDGTGGHTVTFPAQLFEATQPDPRAGACSAQSFIYTTAAGTFFRPVGPLSSEDRTFLTNLNVGGALAVVTNVSVGGTVGATGLVITGGASVSGNLNVGSLQIAGGAPAGQVLTGNGSTYVPVSLPTVPPLSAARNDVTGSRGFGTAYTNTSGGVMYVSGYGTTTGSSVASVAVFIDGDGDFADTDGGTVDGGACGFFFVVPPGSTYQIQINTMTGGGHGVTSVGKWIETVVTV